MRVGLPRTGADPATGAGRRRAWRTGQMFLATALAAPGCIPYAVGSTAHTVPPGAIEPSGIVYGVPNGVDLLRDDQVLTPEELPVVGFDAEVRFGLDEGSDAGLRILPSSGIVGTYKRRIAGHPDGTTPALALQGGLGFVNGFLHVLFELTMLASGPQGTLTPYGGARVMQVKPLSAGAAEDSPTVGGFVGVRIGRPGLAISPEVGYYYDDSALGLREEDHILVVAVGLHGTELLDALAAIARIIPLFR